MSLWEVVFLVFWVAALVFCFWVLILLRRIGLELEEITAAFDRRQRRGTLPPPPPLRRVSVWRWPSL